jgi:hypothetical protein
VSQWQDTLLYFGGSTGLEYSNDLYQYDINTNKWQKLVTTGTAPSPRYKHQAVIHNGALYIIGECAYECIMCRVAAETKHVQRVRILSIDCANSADGCAAQCMHY